MIRVVSYLENCDSTCLLKLPLLLRRHHLANVPPTRNGLKSVLVIPTPRTNLALSWSLNCRCILQPRSCWNTASRRQIHGTSPHARRKVMPITSKVERPGQQHGPWPLSRIQQEILAVRLAVVERTLLTSPNLSMLLILSLQTPRWHYAFSSRTNATIRAISSQRRREYGRPSRIILKGSSSRSY